MKSERQFERMALCCSAVTCALAVLVSAASAIRAAPATSAWRHGVINKVIVVLPLFIFSLLPRRKPVPRLNFYRSSYQHARVVIW
jgi:hypothetical protein